MIETRLRRDASQTGTERELPKDRLYSPLRLGLGYLAGTYILFLLVGQVSAVPNLVKLSGFIALTLASFAIGYHACARRYLRRGPIRTRDLSDGDFRAARRWILASAAYYVAYGLALLSEFGFSGFGSVISAILSPGRSYLNKFDVYERQQAMGETNPAIQLLTLLSVVAAPLVPFAIVYWRRLSLGARIAAVAGIVTYATFFLSIGTLKGLGDILIFAVAGVVVVRLGFWSAKPFARARRASAVALSLTLALGFVAYMAFNQSQRINEIGITSQFEANPVVASVTGEDFARGLSVVAFYPTHGYLGLAYNLESPFVWTGGLGGSRALDSYWAQYTGADSVYESTYPARTEAETGWPALRYWATAYPWFASDLTFPGTILLMGFAGWFFCRFWVQAAFERDRLALLLFAQLALFVAYIPANNQIGTSRTSLITFLVLVGAYVWRGLTTPARRT